MASPFRSNFFEEEDDDGMRDIHSRTPIRRPENVYTPKTSPRKQQINDPFNSPSKAALKYSPAVSFNRRQRSDEDSNFMNSGIGRNFVMAAERDHEIDLAESPRAKFTMQESPKRSIFTAAKVATIHSDDESDGDDVFHSPMRQSPSRFAQSPFMNNDTRTYPNNNNNNDEFSRSTRSNTSARTISPPKPIFSSSTYAAANANSDMSDPFRDQIPNLKPRITTVNTVNSNSTLGSDSLELGKRYTNGSSMFDDQTTIGSRSINEDINFNSSLDGHMFENLPKDFQPRRNNHKAVQKKFRTKNGNLILQNPIPTTLSDFINIKGEDEFDYMTYSAVTSGPDEFIEDGFTIRSSEARRDTEIVVCITMYNEDEEAFTRTFHAVMKNIAYLTKRKNSSTWDKDAWKKVVVLIVADGRNKISPGVLEVLSAIGVYQEGIAKSFVNQKEVKAHLFEYTAQVSMDENLIFKDRDLVPVQVVFCLKEKNAKKINSHRWLFNAICPVLEPKVTVLLDVGTKPNESAIYHLWKAFDLDSNVAGAAGEIVTMKGKFWKKLINPIVASQNFEYKMSNILDKPCESAFGYISVLPGALSAYRYQALKNHEDGTGPLFSYFKGEVSDNAVNTDIFSANMYLAEDRILAWELVAKKDSKWVLKYVKDAHGETDVPETLSEFISQRRRWLNGAFFAALFSQLHFYQIWRTNHSMFRKFMFHVEFVYQFIQLLFSTFSIANFYIIFYYLAGSLIVVAGEGGKILFEIMNYVCVCTLVSMLVISMGNRPQGAPKLFLTAVILLTICGLYSLISGFYFLVLMIKSQEMGYVGGLSFASIIISLVSTYGLYIIMSILYMDPWHIFSSSLQYFLLLPAYTCLLQIYALCNTHDVTWGTKGDNVPTSDLGTATIITDEQGDEIVEIDIIGEQRDIDSMYTENLYQLRERRKTPAKLRDGGVQKQVVSGEDYYRDVRSRVVLVYIIANLILVMTVTQIYSADSIKNNKYLSFILWSVFAFAVFRGVGSLSFLIHLGVRKIVVAKNKWEWKKAERDDNLEKCEKMMEIPS